MHHPNAEAGGHPPFLKKTNKVPLSLSPVYEKKMRPDRSADRYRPVLDGTTRLNRAVQTIAGYLRICFEYALILPHHMVI